MKNAKLRDSESARTDKELILDILLLTYITIILFAYPLIQTGSVLALAIILAITEVILCTHFVHEFGHYCAGRRLGGDKVTMFVSAGYTDADSWNAFTDEQIQKITKAGLCWERTAAVLFTALNSIIFNATDTVPWGITSTILIIVEVCSYLANWRCDVFDSAKTDGYWYRHPDERRHSPAYAKK